MQNKAQIGREVDDEIGTFFVWCNKLLVIVGDY